MTALAPGQILGERFQLIRRLGEGGMGEVWLVEDLELSDRIVATMVLIATSLAVYTSGFIHQGLLVGSLLILAPLLGGLSRAGAFRLAGAGLAGATLGLLTYHPETLSNVFASTLPA